MIWRIRFKTRTKIFMPSSTRKSLIDTKAQVDRCVDDLENMLDKNESAAGTVQKSMKLENSFKPDQSLTFENTLEEFNAWSHSFVAHYDSN